MDGFNLRSTDTLMICQEIITFLEEISRFFRGFFEFGLYKKKSQKHDQGADHIGESDPDVKKKSCQQRASKTPQAHK